MEPDRDRRFRVVDEQNRSCQLRQPQAGSARAENGATLHRAGEAPRIIIGPESLRALARGAAKGINPLNPLWPGRRQQPRKPSNRPQIFRINASCGVAGRRVSPPMMPHPTVRIGGPTRAPPCFVFVSGFSLVNTSRVRFLGGKASKLTVESFAPEPAADRSHCS